MAIVSKGGIKKRLSQILTEVASEKEWIIKALESALDHVHLISRIRSSYPDQRDS